MTQADLVKLVAAREGLTDKRALELIRTVFDVVRIGALSRLHIPGFGVFMPTSRKSRRVRDPQTGRLITLPRTHSIRFRAARALRASLEVSP